MEKKKNIIFIHGRDRVGVDNELNMLIRAFRERQSDTNIEMFRMEEIRDFRTIEQMILSVGLFVEKRLFIFQGDYLGKNEDIIEEFFLRFLKEIDDETFIVLVPAEELSPGLDSWIKVNADARVFSQVFSRESWNKRFRTLDDTIIDEVLEKYERLYSLYEEKKKPKNISYLIRESLEKLSLLSESHEIQKDDILQSIQIEGSGKIFDLIDALLAGNTKKSLDIFRILSSESTMNNFLPGFIGLLRGSVYIRFLKEKKLSESQALKIMKMHPYVVKKAYNSAISWNRLRDFYDKIVSINIAYRSGNGLHDSELGRIFGIERAIISLKK